MSNNITFEEKSIDYEKSLDGDFKKNNGIFYTDDLYGRNIASSGTAGT